MFLDFPCNFLLCLLFKESLRLISGSNVYSWALSCCWSLILFLSEKGNTCFCMVTAVLNMQRLALWSETWHILWVCPCADRSMLSPVGWHWLALCSRVCLLIDFCPLALSSSVTWLWLWLCSFSSQPCHLSSQIFKLCKCPLLSLVILAPNSIVWCWCIRVVVSILYTLQPYVL